MATVPHLGSLIGYAASTAAAMSFDMDNTYKARLSKHIKDELLKGTHPDEIRLAIRALYERRLSPALLGRKVEDLRRSDTGQATQAEPEFPDYRIDPSLVPLESEDE